MSDFDEALSDTDLDLMDSFGDECTKNGSVNVMAVLEQNISRVNEFGEQVFNQYEITTLNSQGRLSMNDQFVFPDARTFIVTDIIEGDEGVTTGAAILG